MLKYKLRDGTEISVDETDPATPGLIVIEDDRDGIVKDKLYYSHDRYGHLIGNSCTIADLYFAIAGENFKLDAPAIVEGSDLIPAIKSYRDTFPDGART